MEALRSLPAPLVTAAQVAAAVPEATAAELASLPGIVTDFAESHCGRPLALRTFDEEDEPDSSGVIRLRTWPVLDCDVYDAPRVALTLAPVAVPGLWSTGVKLRFAGPDPTTPSGVALTSTVSGSRVVTEIAFAPTAGPVLVTVGDLLAAVNATGTWTATLAGDFGACPTAELRALQAAGTAPFQGWGLVAWTAILPGSDLRSTTGSITLGHRSGGGGWSGLAFGGCGFFGSGRVRVRYTAGFNGDPTAGPVTVPGDLAEACLALAKACLDARKVGGVIKQQSLGNTSLAVELAAAVTPGVEQALSRYVDRRF